MRASGEGVDVEIGGGRAELEPEDARYGGGGEEAGGLVWRQLSHEVHALYTAHGPRSFWRDHTYYTYIGMTTAVFVFCFFFGLFLLYDETLSVGKLRFRHSRTSPFFLFTDTRSREGPKPVGLKSEDNPIQDPITNPVSVKRKKGELPNTCFPTPLLRSPPKTLVDPHNAHIHTFLLTGNS